MNYKNKILTVAVISAVQCLPVVLSSDSWKRNTTHDTYGAYVEYKCKKPGTRMLDGATHRVARCDANGQWSENITDCTGGF